MVWPDGVINVIWQYWSERASLFCIPGMIVCELVRQYLCLASSGWWSHSPATKRSSRRILRRLAGCQTRPHTGTHTATHIFRCTFNMYVFLFCNTVMKTISHCVCLRLMSAMQVTSPDTEVTVDVKYFYVLACKPAEDWALNCSRAVAYCSSINFYILFLHRMLRMNHVSCTLCHVWLSLNVWLKCLKESWPVMWCSDVPTLHQPSGSLI